MGSMENGTCGQEQGKASLALVLSFSPQNLTKKERKTREREKERKRESTLGK
jgi:hypothetical protein